MGTRVLSLWLPYLATDRLRLESQELAPGQRRLPLATCLSNRENQPLVALCPRAERAGLRPGMARIEAVSRVPGLSIHPSETERDQQLLKRSLAWCERYTPFAAVDRSFPAEQGAALWLDIGSAAHLAGGEASLLAKLLGMLKREGVVAKAAIADHPGCAWAACRFGSEEQRILPSNGARVALAPMPISALRLEKADCTKIESAGLDRIEHLYALPRHSLSARFGDHVATRLDQALGLVDEPIAVDIPRPAQQAQMIFAEPITTPDILSASIERLIRQLCIGLEAAGLGARRLTLALYRVDNSTITCSVGVDRPSRDMKKLTALIGERLDTIDLGFGLERAILDAVEIEPLLSESIRWQGLGTAADDPLPDLAGEPNPRTRSNENGRLRRAEWQDRIDDHARQPPAPPFLGVGRRQTATLPMVAGSSAVALAYSPQEIEQPVLQETAPRPLRLLRQPEPIEAIASLPGEPPVLFRWRQRLHKVIGARGPETVSPDWWRIAEEDRPSSPRTKQDTDTPASLSRDYFAVEDSEGARFWLFREGCYDDNSAPLPRWFLHGVFG